jgi:hypothetical protein
MWPSVSVNRDDRRLEPRRRVLAHGGNTAAAATAVRQITARLIEQHGAAAVRDLADALALELADANCAVATINEGDGNVGD